MNSDELVATGFLSSETRGNPTSVGVKEEIIGDQNSFTRYSLSASDGSRDMQLNYHLRHSAAGTKRPPNQNPTTLLTASDSNLPYVYDAYILPHVFDFATRFHGLYVVRWKSVPSVINTSLFCFHSDFSRRREGHVGHHVMGLVLPSAVQPRVKHGRAETVSRGPDILKC